MSNKEDGSGTITERVRMYANLFHRLMAVNLNI